MTDRTGNASARDYGDEFARLNFVVQGIIGRKVMVELVRVVAVQAAGEVAPVGVLDVVPMVHQVDGAGKAVEHGTIHNVPYFRIQGGANAIILDPQVGDIGIAVFAGRDTSKVKATRAPALPGSKRRFDWADALYIGGVLNGTPTAWVRFSSEGLELKASAIKIIGNVDVTGDITASGEVKAGPIALGTHRHSGVQTGGGTSGGPVA